MISYFKVNDPYRLIGVFLLLLAIRVPILLIDMPMILPELKWLLIGEKLADGALMYRDIWDNTSPLAAFVYKWLNVLFGKTVVPFQILSIVLVICQAGIFNGIMLSNKAYNQNTYVPAFIYMIVMNSYFDFMTLSPVMMSMTFILLAMNNLFRRMDNTTQDELFVFTGVFLGLATLFFLPSVLFFLVTVLALFLYTGSIVRRILLLIYGYAVVLALCSLYYYWYDGGLFFHEYFYASLFTLSSISYMTSSEIIIALIIPIVILVVSIVKMIQEGHYINFQVKIQLVMFYFLIAGLLSMIMIKEVSTYQLIIFVPSVAFFITHYLLTVKNWILAEITASLIVVAFIMNHLITFNGWLFFDNYVSYDQLIVQESQYEKILRDKKVIVLGEELHHYQNSKLATPFLNWHFSSRLLSNPSYYDNITLIYTKMEEDLPEVILDQKDVMQNVFDYLPTLASQYKVLSGAENIYIKKD